VFFRILLVGFGLFGPGAARALFSRVRIYVPGKKYIKLASANSLAKTPTKKV